MLVGTTEIQNREKQAQGRYVSIEGEKFYQIENFDAMQPFFISLASDTDLWMYVSSTGGLTCGRKSPDQALFPYYTDDKITESYHHTGPATLVRVKLEDQTYLWEPFADRTVGLYDVRRSIYKSVTGNKLLFEEENLTLGVAFSYMWTSADRYGWIRKATLSNHRAEAVEMEVLDGLQNILPSGTSRVTQNTYSTLVDGYKKTEQAGQSPLVLFRMEAIMVDRAEPSESLRCNTVYALGLPGARILTSNRAMEAFRRGEQIEAEPESKGVRGAFFCCTKVALMGNASKQWYMVADVEKDACDVKQMMADMERPEAIADLEKAVSTSTATLCEIVALNDGFQHSADEHTDARHFANVLFNTMRGGFYVDNYRIGGPAFAAHVKLFNEALAAKHAAFLEALPETITYGELEEAIRKTEDAQLLRLFFEYLPLTFSRRHGDPSRPWNLFSIRVNDKNGRRLISYQGNWRDIFQNWEALSLSYPGYIRGIITKFLCATTIDGYNPYKVTSEGIDWELINPDDPWSNIGYWGDHQIVYLLKLLELAYEHDPEALKELATSRIFAFANVPYRFKSYQELVADPKNSIRFADAVHEEVMRVLPQYGQDARLILKDGQPLLASFTEKILVSFLTKFSNFIPEAGVWMNTLRPEWNDANNALVGYGASMVTLCYMRRYAAFFRKFYAEMEAEELVISKNVQAFLQAVMQTMGLFEGKLEKGFCAKCRREYTDQMGHAGEAYREAVYAAPVSDDVMLEKAELLRFLDQAIAYMDASIRKNQREDGLYHAYNLITFTADGLEVSYLYEMLEGQVAVLTSGLLSAEEVAALLDTLRHSALYREDQRSYMLYPNRRRASFLEKNNLPEEVAAWPEADTLVAHGILTRDLDGVMHFSASFNNADFLKRALEKEGLMQYSPKLEALYEEVFCHRAFTGRSGTFYKYEGLGSIYWHMVSKLLLAVGENIARYAETAAPEVVERLKAHYRAIQEGIGAHKQPAEYGSFPFDPYSHTPSMAGVQQPGMTGQVKEDIINRFFELGISVEQGAIRIRPTMLREEEFLHGELRFTYCAVPFVYTIGQQHKGVKVLLRDKVYRAAELELPASICQHLFARDGEVEEVNVSL